MDELEWAREDAQITDDERGQAVTDLIDLVVAVDGILQAQAAADADYFITASEGEFSNTEQQAIQDTILKAYRWQYIVSGIQDGRFLGALTGMITHVHAERITTALAALMQEKRRGPISPILHLDTFIFVPVVSDKLLLRRAFPCFS
jgi:hypothetical protein